MHVALAGAWTVSDDAWDGLDAPRRVLGAVPGPASLPETHSKNKSQNKTHRYKRCIDTEALACVWAWRVPGPSQTMPATVWMPRAGSWELFRARRPSLKHTPRQIEK